MKHLTIIATLFLSVTFIIGCGSGTVVTGTVKYTDGTPITVGSVRFDGTTKSFFGKVAEDGSYTVKSASGSGVPVGSYAVYLSGMERIESADGTAVNPLSQPDLYSETSSYKTVLTVAAKYTSPETSGLTCEVNGGKQTFDITVERP